MKYFNEYFIGLNHGFTQIKKLSFNYLLFKMFQMPIIEYLVILQSFKLHQKIMEKWCCMPYCEIHFFKYAPICCQLTANFVPKPKLTRKFPI